METPELEPDGGEVPASLEEEVEVLGEGYVEALRRGDRPDRESLVRSHPELSPWLERRLRLMEWMHRLASSAGKDAEGASPVRLRCPRCHRTVLLRSRGPGEVACERCGSNFRVEGGPEAAWPAEELPRMVGKFRVTALLGQGAFGIVYRAEDTELERTVTLKVPRAGYFRSPEEASRFLREARSAARLCHPGIVQVHEVTEVEGMPCIVREYIEGRALDGLLSGGRWSLEKGARLAEEVAEALDHAHRQGVIHRDVKPENIIVDGAGHAHVTDFGLARREEGEVTITVDGQVLGTPAYMSPEQAAGDQDRVDGRSDVYSLGVVLYELITGERPFAGTRNMVLHQVLHDEPRPPRRLNDRIPRDLETICTVAMQKERIRRYASAGDLRDDLRRFLRGEPIRARPVGRAEAALRWCRRNPVVAALTAAIALLVLVVTAGSIAAAFRFKDAEWKEKEAGRRVSMALEVSRRRLVRLNVASGTRIFEAGDRFGALPYLAEALRDEREEPEARILHRLRLLSTIDRCPRLVGVWRHRGEVSLVAFSPDGRLVLCASRDPASGEGLVSSYDLETGGPACRPWAHPAPVTALQSSPEGLHVLTACADGGIRIWEVSSGRSVRGLQHGTSCSHAEYSPDGSLVLSVGPDGSARVWSAASGGPIADLRHEHGLEGGTFSPDGRRVATACFDTAVIWDLEKGERLVTVRHEPAERIIHLRFSPDGKRLATAGFQRAARVWDAATGWPIGEPMVHGRGVTRVAFSPDGKRLATSSWDRGRIWDAATGAPLTPPMKEQCDQISAAFSPDGRYVVTTSGFQRTATVWDAHGGEVAFPEVLHSRIAWHAAFHPQGHLLLTAGGDGMVRLWDLSRGRPKSCQVPRSAAARGVEVSVDGRHLVVPSKDKAARIIRADTGAVVARLEHGSTVGRAIFRPGRPQVLTSGNDGLVVLWDFETGDRLYAVTAGPEGAAPGVEFDPTGELLLTRDDPRAVTLRDAATGAPRSGCPRLASAAVLAFSGDGRRLCSRAADGGLVLVSLPDGKEVWRRLDPGGGIAAAAFDGRGTRIATGHGDGGAWIRDVAAGETLVQIGDPRHLDRERGRKLPHSSPVNHIEFSPDDRHLLTSSPDGARVWDAATGEGASRWLHPGGINRAAFSPDGRFVAAASRGGMGQVLDWRTGDPVAPPLLHGAEVLWIGFDRRAERVFTAGADDSVKIWDLPRDGRSDEDLVRLAGVLSGQHIEGGTPEFLPAEEIEEGWRSLRSNDPREFSVDPMALHDWHLQEAAMAEEQSDPFGLVWHAGRILDGGRGSLPAEEKMYLHRMRAEARAELGRYEASAEDFDRVIEEDPGDFRSLGSRALLALALGDGAGYRRECGRLLERARGSKDSSLIRHAVLASILASGAAPDPEELLGLAKGAGALPLEKSPGDFGSALFRAGKPREAILQLTLARFYYPEGQPTLLGGTTQNLLFLAMAYRDAGLEMLAGRTLEKAEGGIAEELRSGKSSYGAKLRWQDRLRREILLEEARARLGK